MMEVPGQHDRSRDHGQGKRTAQRSREQQNNGEDGRDDDARGVDPPAPRLRCLCGCRLLERPERSFKIRVVDDQLMLDLTQGFSFAVTEHDAPP